MQRFFVNVDILIGIELILSDNVVRHLNVLRLNLGQEIVLFNGNGHAYLANLVELTRKSARALILKEIITDCENKVPIRLGLCLISSDKMDLAIQKAVELGVSTIIPLVSEYSQRISQDRMNKRMEHWQNIVISSCEQCGGNVLTKLGTLTQFKTFIVDGIKSELNLILSPAGQRLDNLTRSEFGPKNVNLVVGPEGGFSRDEVEFAKEHQYLNLALGKRIMRAETAVITGISVVKTITGDF